MLICRFVPREFKMQNEKSKITIQSSKLNPGQKMPSRSILNFELQL